MMTKPKVYLETSVFHYLAAAPSHEPMEAAWQSVTRRWWELRRSEFDLFVSELVHFEAGAGDHKSAGAPLELLEVLPVLAVTEEAIVLARKFISDIPLPKKARVDAVHLALAADHGMDYLLTCDCIVFANAVIRRGIERTCFSCGYDPPLITTPFELLGEDLNRGDSILRAVRGIREDAASRCIYDLRDIHTHLTNLEWRNSRHTVRLPARRKNAT